VHNYLEWFSGRGYVAKKRFYARSQKEVLEIIRKDSQVLATDLACELSTCEDTICRALRDQAGQGVYCETFSLKC
jgi:hypothetical protein